ncbi:helix-turn-helix transcriptional regulator [Hazenella sp. IB182357]|uniref:Helix-turn-helix transcriptional regulator n=1 Tax=Polycladospora coralii TaxID=2771432 RepID=A0A926NDG3_9BACL|nr:helix-turn-helix transcriptional regulator [Polycladospora coralii]MBD1373780.1 helix-turn-helix transcriptional regulator [Polycladospora coralii]
MSLKSARIAQGLTQKKLAQMALISQSYYNEIESGKKKNPSTKVMQRIIQILDTNLDIFFNNDIA